MASPVQSITRAEIDHFWRRKKLEEEEHRLADEKEAARIKVKSLKVSTYFPSSIKNKLGSKLNITVTT
jgi:hypothetical protein